jgi:quaternary ammonium compound-resistance protein SugE
MALSVYLLSVALKSIPVGTGYAVWTGIGAVGTAVLGMILFNEPREIGRIICILLIVTGILGLKFFSK